MRKLFGGDSDHPVGVQLLVGRRQVGRGHKVLEIEHPLR